MRQYAPYVLSKFSADISSDPATATPPAAPWLVACLGGRRDCLGTGEPEVASKDEVPCATACRKSRLEYAANCAVRPGVEPLLGLPAVIWKERFRWPPDLEAREDDRRRGELQDPESGDHLHRAIVAAHPSDDELLHEQPVDQQLRPPRESPTATARRPRRGRRRRTR